jgi:hypothetical protein
MKNYVKKEKVWIVNTKLDNILKVLYSLFDFCEQNYLNLKVVYKATDTFKEIEGYISGYHPELEMVTIKGGEQGYDYVIPKKNIEENIITGKIF